MALGAVLTTVGLAVIGRSIVVARERRRQLKRGEIHELMSLWTLVGRSRIHARASMFISDSKSPPIVLVHGFGMSSSYFRPAAERLAARFNVYAPDLPGHGKSDPPKEPLDIPQLADALVSWMDAVGLTRTSIVAHSMGCLIAIDAAANYPERIDRLVLIGPAGDPAGRTVTELVRRFLTGVPYERASLLRILLMDYARLGPRLLPELRFLVRDRIEEKLQLVTAPTMLLRGEKDAVAPRCWLNELARLVSAKRITEIPDWGHAVHYSAAHDLTNAITPFLCDSFVIPSQVTSDSTIQEVDLQR